MKIYLAAVACLAMWSFSNIAVAQTQMEFKAFDAPPGVNKERIAAMAKAMDFDNWPDTKALFGIPRISKVLLKNPAAVTQVTKSCGKVSFGGTPWDDCHWSWRRLTERAEPAPDKFPSELRKRLLEALSEEQLKDRRFVEAHLKRSMERYQKAWRYRLEGQMDIEACQTPSGRAAKEFLLARLADNMMSTEALAAMYSTAKRPKELGTVGFYIQSRRGDDSQITFSRNNIFVTVRANGFFVGEALEVAKKIDNMIIHQPSLSFDERQE
ncbi:MAG: hypothetical protein OEZ04_11635 [Nitrospinota bacterium]|nr:hypothetical protein [Nitrospinota bacterium]